MASDLLSPTPAPRVVHFDLDTATNESSSASATPQTSTITLLPPPPASPSPSAFADPSSTSYSDAGPSSSLPLFRYSEDDDPPIASTSYSRDDSTSFYPPKPLASGLASREARWEADPDDLDSDFDEGQAPLMEGLVHSRRSLDLRAEERRLKEMESDAESDEQPEWINRGGGIWAGIANMSNSILGAGIIGLPYALREAGFFSGIILLLILGSVTDWTIRLIVLNAKMSGRRTYIDIMDSCFGRHGRAAVSFFQFAFAFGGMCAFTVITGDTLPRVLLAIVGDDHGSLVDFLISRHVVTTVLTVGISYPLSLYRDIEKLSHASTLALISMVVIVFSVGIRGPGVDETLKGDSSTRWTFLEPGVFEAIGVISFAFVCHHNSLLIYGSLRTPTLDRFAQITHVSTALSMVACLCMSISGFLVFTDRTQGNILNNFAEDDTLINIARACFGANMFATLPLEAFVCREVAETYFWPDEREFNKKRHVLITSGLVFSALLVSLVTCDLGLILELAGGFSATALAYLFPAACFLRLSGTGPQQAPQRFAAWVCAAFGVAVMVLSTFLSIRKALKGGSHKASFSKPRTPISVRQHLLTIHLRTSPAPVDYFASSWATTEATEIMSGWRLAKDAGPPGDVDTVEVLESQPDAKKAARLLQKIHSLVKPIMKKHGWFLPTLAEFFPKNPNLLGININAGEKICIRLRLANDPYSFLPLEESLIGTMLHELTHNRRGPHDDAFFKILDGLQVEYDALRASGYTGEGFHGKGNRVGEGVSHDKGVSMREAREKALRRFEEKEKIRKLLGTGGRLGGKAPAEKGKRMAEVLAETAERRLRASRTCGGDDAHSHPSGSKKEDLPPEIQAEIAAAEKDSRRVVIDLTTDSSDDEDDCAAIAGESSIGLRIKPEPAGELNLASSSSPSKRSRASSASSEEIEIVSSKRPVPARPPASAKPLHSAKSAAAASIIPANPFDSRSRTTASSSAPAPSVTPRSAPQKPTNSKPRPLSRNATPQPAWTCSTCTFANPSPLSLACEVCLTERPPGTLVVGADIGPSRRPTPVTRDKDGGWACETCSTRNEDLFWTCRVCGRLKRSSERG
ncbi:hypothetical protein JCM11641_007359 [Rhodosporidiobolus odoratus]